MNSFIVTAYGFVKDILFNKEKLKYEFIYTDKVREAKPYKAPTARGIIAKHFTTKIEGNEFESEDSFIAEAWVFSPWAQEPIRASYEVVKERDYNSYSSMPDGIPVPEVFVARKMSMENLTDAKFLNDRNPKKGMSLEEAKALAAEKNKQFLKEYRKAIKEQQKRQRI